MSPSAGPRMSPGEIVASMGRFRALRILVVGDLFLDEYIEGEMYEISKEGPIPVLRLESRLQTAGAAGNLASSIRNLGAQVAVVGLVGKDPNGKVLVSELRKKKIDTEGIIVDPARPTLTYSKVRARVENTPSREILRLDVLPGGPLDPTAEKEVLAAVKRRASAVDGIIVLDQVHHLISKSLLRALPGIASSAKAVLHGSSRDHIGDFHGFSLITPNDRESHRAAGGDPQDVERLGRSLQKRGGHRQVILTLGALGMALFPQHGAVERLPSFARRVVDVTGAGDALSSVAVLGNVLGWDLQSLAWTASQAAAIAVEHVGTHHVTDVELKQRIIEAAAGGGTEPRLALHRHEKF